MYLNHPDPNASIGFCEALKIAYSVLCIELGSKSNQFGWSEISQGSHDVHSAFILHSSPLGFQ